ncbi:MAG: porin [Pseudomonadota bacterium]
MQLNNTLIAAAVTAALAASANVSAETTVYGKIHTSVAAVSQDTCTPPTVNTNCDFSGTAISSHSSRVGIKAKKALENGMEISGKAEFELDAVSGSYSKSKDYDLDFDGDTVTDATVTDNDKYIFKPRNIYVGLKGGFGEVRVGHHDTPHKIATGKLDPFSDTYADYNNIITVANRLDNVVAYLNKFGPVGVAAAYHAGDDSVEAENNGAATSIMINYDQGPLYVAAAVESYGDTVADDLQTATVIGAGYKIGPVDLGLVHETLAYDGNSIDDVAETYFSAKYKLNDKNTIKLAYGMRDDGESATDDEVMTAVGFDHKLDKSASVYALYAAGSDGGLAKKGKLDGDASAFALGLVYKF